MALAAPFPAAVRSDRPRQALSRPARACPGMRLTRRGRLAVILASMAFLALATLGSGRFPAEASGATGPSVPATAIVVVQSGETLWQIAQAVAPQSDPRETVGTIRALNGLGNEPIRPGQSLVVPASS